MPSLHFKGKVFVQNHHLTVPFHELVPVKAKGLSGTPSLHDNVIVHGDNLSALKALLPTYHGKVKCIYIDPPYNTGNEGWAYNDNVSSPMMRDWLGKTVDREDLTRHDKWCCMMLPRLKLLRELLRDDGAIFISIDDNEIHHLRCLMDEVFGEENFVAQMVWEGAFKNDAQQIGVSHEYVVVYARSILSAEKVWTVSKEGVELVLREVARLREQFGDDYEGASRALGAWFLNNKATTSFAHRRFRYIDGRGAYKLDDPTAPGGRKIELRHPQTGKVIPLRPGRGWVFDQIRFEEMVKEERITFVSETSIMVRRYLHETDRITPQSVFYQPMRSGSERLRNIEMDPKIRTRG